MKALPDCTYTAFISYAHADDEAWFSWVSQFKNELERGLAAMLRGVKLPPMHLSGQNGPVAGVLTDELTQRVAASFAMIIVVHDNYAQSDWCLKELEYFKSLFGDDGFRQRLYIVAMSEQAMLSVSSGAAWKRLMPTGDQVWMSFFDPADRARPLDIYMGPGVVSPAFKMPFERLRRDLVEEIRRPVVVSRAAPPEPPRLMQPPAETVAALVLLGFVPPAAAAAAAAAAQSLGAHGVTARVLAQDTVFSDFADFDDAQRLVLAFDDTPPMMAALAPGGHLELQREAWLRKGKPADHLHWLDLRAEAPPPAQWRGAAAWVAQQPQPRPLDLPALCELIGTPPRPAAVAPMPGVRIYIESNRYERNLWETLGDQICRKWDELARSMAPGRVPPLTVRARGLPVDDIDAFPSLDDADGVVLLWGRKTSEALVAQINKVENKMMPGRDAAPGIVAFLMPPQQSAEPVPAWGWKVLRFDATSEDRIDVVHEESSELDRFLRKVYERRLQRDGVPLP